jgi:hypothetical protein
VLNGENDKDTDNENNLKSERQQRTMMSVERRDQKTEAAKSEYENR